MCQGKLEECEVFIKIIDSMKEIVKKINIHINSKGIFIEGLDYNHTIFVSTFLQEKVFRTYFCPSPLICGVAIENLDQILYNVNENGSMTIQCEEKPTLLNLIFESKSGNKHSKFSLPLLNLDIVHMNIPQHQFSSICTMPFDNFNQICKELGGQSETIKIEISKSYIQFSIPEEFGKRNQTRRVLGGGDYHKVVLIVEKSASLNLSAKLLNLFSKAAELSSEIMLHMSNETPLVTKVIFANGCGELKYYLAPKIIDEEQQV